MVEKKLYLDEVIKVSYIPLIYNEFCIVADKEYKKFIGNVFKFTFKARGGAIKLTFSELQSAQCYVLLADGISYNEDLIKTPASFMIYFQSPTAGAVLEIILWR